MQTNCENCMNLVYDEEFDDYVCAVDMDEDETAQLMANPNKACPYFRFGDEYTIVKKQI